MSQIENVYSFVFKINPVPASRPRVSRWSTYYSKSYEVFRKDMSKLMRTYPKSLLKGELRASIKFFRAIPISFSKKKKEEMEGQYVVSNFDLDNLEKAIYDAMNDHVFVDDSQIVHHETSKHWSSNPRIEVTLHEV